MSKIIKINLLNQETFRITYIMTESCPYACRYCPDRLHTGSHKKINIEAIEKLILRFKDRRIVFVISGGEATTHPQFIDFLQMLKKHNIKISVDSNSVRTKRFYQEYAHLVDNWCISLHPSQHILDLEKLKIVSQLSFLVVYLLMDPDHWKKSLDWFNKLSQLKDINLIPKKIMEGWGGNDSIIKYSEEQERFLVETDSIWLFTKKREDELRKTHMWLQDMGSIATHENGTTSIVEPYDFIRKQEHKFNGWTCYAGKQSISIYPDQSAEWANCGIKKYKHFLEIDPNELEKPLICDREYCFCGTDIRSDKHL